MTTQTSDDDIPIEQRLASLEATVRSLDGALRETERRYRRTRRHARLAIGACGALCAVTLLGAMQQSPINADLHMVTAPFTVLDANGKWAMNVDALGQVTVGPRLDVTGPGGKVTLTSNLSEAGLIVESEQGKPLLHAGSFSDEGVRRSGVSAMNEGGRVVAGVGINPFGDGGAVFATNDDRSQQVGLKTRDDGSAGLYYYKDGALRTHLGELQKGNVALRVLGSSESINLAAIGQSVEGTGGAIRLRDENNNVRVALNSSTKNGEAGSVFVYDERGEDAVAGIASNGTRAVVFAGPNATPSVLIGESEVTKGAGLFQLTLGGFTAVEAGVQEGGGVVRVFQQGKKSNALRAGIQLPGMMSP